MLIEFIIFLNKIHKSTEKTPINNRIYGITISKIFIRNILICLSITSSNISFVNHIHVKWSTKNPTQAT